MMKIKYKILSALLAFCLVMGLLPATALAEENNPVVCLCSDLPNWGQSIMTQVGDGTKDVDGTGWSFVAETSTLTIEENTEVIEDASATVTWNVVNKGLISGLPNVIFGGTVTNVGIINSNASFKGAVINTGTIISGKFYGAVSGNGSITGGYFTVDTRGLEGCYLGVDSDMVSYGKQNILALHVTKTDTDVYVLPDSIVVTLDEDKATEGVDYTYEGAGTATGTITLSAEASKKKVAITCIAQEAVDIVETDFTPVDAGEWVQLFLPKEATVGEPFEYQFKSKGAEPIKWEADFPFENIGLTLAQDTGVLSGTPTVAFESYAITLKARNNTTDDQVTVYLKINPQKYYKLDVAPEAQGKVVIGSADPSDEAIRVDEDGQYWVRGGDSTINILPAPGYVFQSQPEITFKDGKGNAVANDESTFVLAGVTGEGTIAIEAVLLENTGEQTDSEEDPPADSGTQMEDSSNSTSEEDPTADSDTQMEDGSNSPSEEEPLVRSAVQTADNSNFLLWFAFLMASCAGFFGIASYGRKKKAKQ